MPPKRKAIQGLVQTPLKKVKMEPKSDPDSDSDASSTDLTVTSVDNQDLIVSVREVETANSKQKVILLSISNSRPDTALGKAQGDHVTSYKTFLEMLVTATEGMPLKKVAKTIAKTAEALLPDKKENFEKILEKLDEEISATMSAKKRNKIIETLEDSGDYNAEELKNIRENLKSSRRGVFMKIVEQMGQEFIKQINLDESTAFRKSGAADTAEGSRVKKAIHALKAINDLKTIIDVSDDNDEKRADAFYEKYIKIGAPYKDGANEVFGKNGVKKISNALEETEENDKRSILAARFSSAFDKNKIATLFGDLFDFQYQKHKEGGLELLSEVVAKHLVVMFNAFDQFQSFDNKNEIVEVFYKDCILKNQGWCNLMVPIKLEKGFKNESLTTEIIKEEVKKLVDFNEFRMLSNEEIKKQSVAKKSNDKEGKGK